ncbi:MAG: 2-amino-4-hydroxy-6-hydroxymethyldihydropteridine diphosphokinase [Chloroflexi bacterium]|nr:2-amino-4-hydroxy-6-hydroxymethyldihydropteridine diphosphokinase [Chloroflexota bacterium]
MSNLHHAYLDLGSNLEPEENIPLAIKLLCEVGEIAAVSSVWETESVGYAGPNFLNVCVLLLTPLDAERIKYEINRPIEAQMGRVRGEEKNAPRPIDIDIVLFDGTPHNVQTWNQAFIIVPLAELLPEFKTPGGEKLSGFAKQLKSQVWMRKREDILISLEVPRRG